jgi:hypothetical protein
MPLIATLSQRTASPISGQPAEYSLRLANNQATAVNVTAVQPFVQVPAGVNTSLITNGAIGQIVAQAPALPAAFFPLAVPANSAISIQFAVNFVAPVAGYAYQLSAQVQASDGTSATAAAVAVSPTTVGPTTMTPQAWLTTLFPIATEDFSSPLQAFFTVWP